MEKCTAKITRFELPLAKVQGLLENNGGDLSLSLTPYLNDLASMETQYWKYHSPWGNPGDKVYILEKFRVERLCQSADGYMVTYKFEDGAEVQVPSNIPVAVTAKNNWLAGSSAPEGAIRLKMVIQDVQVTGEDWVFTLAKVADDQS